MSDIVDDDFNFLMDAFISSSDESEMELNVNELRQRNENYLGIYTIAFY